MIETGIYLFTGPEAGEKNDAINGIRDESRKVNGSLDEYRYFAADVRVADVIAQLQNESLFSSALFIVLRNAETIKTKAEIELIAGWAKQAQASGNILILVSDEMSVDKKLENAVPAGHRKIFWEMFENRKEQWLISYFKKNGFGVSADAVSQILEMVENNTESLKSECSRFFYCFEAGHQISAADVDKILTHNREESAFTLFESMCDKSKGKKERFETAVEILNKIRLSRESNAVAVIAGLTYCFRQLRNWNMLFADGRKPTDAQIKAGGFASKKNQERYKVAATIWSKGAVASIISLLAATDMNIRQEGSAFEDTRLVMLLHSIIIKEGIYCSDYSDL
ncbi:DNA polymerase III subunit delta [Treponema sp.]|uniref:DNA polymerase III subunit delta n=1 Tax=Treponema sp. TaxID=166 RepID=UPI0025F79245|nr:DNA polymerase III subunit delta [Treponema sp.]MCR5218939.1 DNA polymerase III subunit delta [Treponema sp.]